MKDEGKRKIEELVERFSRNIDVYKSGSYNEAQTRRELIEPFFEALGWDVYNRQGYAEQYKDVVHEDSVKVGVSLKAPDYSFRIGGQRKFFLEAKKPSVSIKDDIDPSYQLRRYAWSAKLPLSILTDFEELAVYDCRIKPSPRDKVGTGRIAYYTYNRYIDEFDAIYNVFSRDAVLKGSFDRYAVTTAGKRGTAEVDREFLKEIEGWRDSLARNIAIRNPKLTVDEMNFAVQQTIDRLIFLRICEDRGIEQYGSLQALLNGANTYRRLFELFYQADTKYNSGLFDFSADKLTPDIKIDDDVIKSIIDSLYYPKSPYEFSVLGVDILGNVYEQFLGKVIRLTAGHNAKVEEKPEVKKAGGVYYTPEYIVEYIVQNTIGKLLGEDSTFRKGEKEEVPPLKKGDSGGFKKNTPKAVSHLRILDPACGSGSFLIGAYQYLLSYHLKWYIENSPEKYAKGKFPAVYRSGEGWRLTTQEKKRILLNNIFGVDIDRQAVEVTKLSLLLKVLEDENRETIGKNLLLFRERVLPNLDSNIKCGNSLISPDFYNSAQPSFTPLWQRGNGGILQDDEIRRINPFDWHDQEKGFGKIMKEGGFDCIIGNPPWGAEFTEVELTYLRDKNNEIIVRMIDSFMYFVYQAFLKLSDKGSFGMILPDVILYQNDNYKLRDYLLKNFNLRNIINLGNDVFKNVNRPACILIFDKSKTKNNRTSVVDLCLIKEKDKVINLSENYIEIKQKSFLRIPSEMLITKSATDYELLDRILDTVSFKPLKEFVDSDGIQRGVSPDLKEAFIINKAAIKKFKLEISKLKPTITGGKQVKRYYIDYQNDYLIYTKRDDDFRTIPNICKYIDQFKDRITCTEVKQKKHPLYALHRSRDENIFLKPHKLIGVITEDELIIALDDNILYPTDGCYLFSVAKPNKIKYILALLNSKLFVFLYRLISLEEGRPLAQVKPSIIKEYLPIRTIDFNNKKEKAMHDQVASLVDKMLDLNEKLKKTKTPHDRELIERQIKATDSQIDRLVYELYGLTEEERKTVEGNKCSVPS